MKKYKADGDRSKRAFFLFEASFSGEIMSRPLINYVNPVDSSFPLCYASALL
jgi:hypothetical protein